MGRVPCWPLVFCGLRGCWTCEWPAGEDKQPQAVLRREEKMRHVRAGGRGLGHTRKSWLPRCPVSSPSSRLHDRLVHRLDAGVFCFCFFPSIWPCAVVGLGAARGGSTHRVGRPPSRSTAATGFGSFHSSALQSIYPFPLLPPPHLLFSSWLMIMINPYDRYVSDNSSDNNTPSRTRISFSRKAAPVVSITTTSAISIGQENRSPTSCIPFPSTPLPISAAQSPRDAMYIPCPSDLSTPEQTAHIPSTCSHHRRRSNSGLVSIQRRDPRLFAALNFEPRASVGCIDLGKSTAVLAITSSGIVSRVENGHIGKTLANARQRRLQQLDRKRNTSMITKRQTKKASMDAKFLITLHHSITWHIENRANLKGRFFFPSV